MQSSCPRHSHHPRCNSEESEVFTRLTSVQLLSLKQIFKISVIMWLYQLSLIGYYRQKTIIKNE